ncbi:MAG TPA: PDZ domain-containing protein, partial [Lentimicrobium sp.]|nr:PDZ domain-containing protein [Lentimicrobium sp.]
DIILNVEGVAVNSTSELLELVGQHKPGDKINVAVSRDGKDMDFKVTLKNRDGNLSLVKREDVDVQSLLGANLTPVSDDLKSDLDLDYGVQVNSIREGKLRNAGVRQGFIITQIDGKPVKSVKDLGNAIESKKKGGILIEGIYPNRTRAYYGFGI